ncbi:MAG: hypothetical protein M1820_010678 [Bogoriella megaspora]|nr:MAG: hypothetical protein M1820_010678 [Bogoriella megaspora]
MLITNFMKVLSVGGYLVVQAVPLVQEGSEHAVDPPLKRAKLYSPDSPDHPVIDPILMRKVNNVNVRDVKVRSENEFGEGPRHGFTGKALELEIRDETETEHNVPYGTELAPLMLKARDDAELQEGVPSGTDLGPL